MIFIGRLFNPHFLQIYQYSPFVQYLLWTLLTIFMIAMIVYSVDFGLFIQGIDYPDFIDDAILSLHLIADCILCVVTMILFFRPICGRRNETPKSPRIDMSVLCQYGIISALQLVSAISFQMSVLVGMYLGNIHAAIDVLSMYRDICGVIQMIDCLLLMVCIYLGFARREIETSSCRICELFCIWYFCSCSRLHEYERLFELDQLRQQRLREQLLPRSCRNDNTPEESLVVITNTPPLQYSTEEKDISSTSMIINNTQFGTIH